MTTVSLGALSSLPKARSTTLIPRIPASPFGSHPQVFVAGSTLVGSTVGSSGPRWVGILECHWPRRDAPRSMAEAMRAGIDPATAKRRARAATVRDSFAAVTEEWLKRDQAGNRSHDDTKRIMTRYPLPVWGDRPITRVTRRDCIELIDGVVDLGRLTMAHRLHGHLHRLFRWAVGRDILEVNPMTDLPRQGKLSRRDRKLDDVSWRWYGEQQMKCRGLSARSTNC